MPADWCPACGPYFIGRCPHVPVDPKEVRRRVEDVMRASEGACPNGHPAACVTSTSEGTASCAWCDEVAELAGRLTDLTECTLDHNSSCGCVDCLRAGLAEHTEALARWGERALVAEAALAEANALLALYSGGRAGKVPEGWKAEDGWLYCYDACRVVQVYGDGRWLWKGRINGEHAVYPGPRPVLQACAEAEAWLKAQEVKS